MKLRKAFRFRMRPDAAQSQALARMAGARRWVWNWALAQRQQHYRETGKHLPLAELSRRLTAWKQQPESVWLQDIDSQALQQVLSDFERAYQSFFRKRAGFPRFKSRKRDPARFRIPQRVVVSQSRVYVPKVGVIRIRNRSRSQGNPKARPSNRTPVGTGMCRWSPSSRLRIFHPLPPIPPGS